LSLIWSTTSSRILLDGKFLAMDPLQKVLDIATQQGLLTPIELTQLNCALAYMQMMLCFFV
jgi:hypothetical protein